jgi:hypothetical protein
MTSGKLSEERATTTHIYHLRRSDVEDKEKTGSQNEAGRVGVSTDMIYDFRGVIC